MSVLDCGKELKRLREGSGTDSYDAQGKRKVSPAAPPPKVFDNVMRQQLRTKQLLDGIIRSK